MENVDSIQCVLMLLEVIAVDVQLEVVAIPLSNVLLNTDVIQIVTVMVTQFVKLENVFVHLLTLAKTANVCCFSNSNWLMLTFSMFLFRSL